MSNILAKGMYAKQPSPNAPEFVKFDIDVKVDDAVEFLKSTANDKGYVNLSLKIAKSGNPYLEAWIKDGGQAAAPAAQAPAPKAAPKAAPGPPEDDGDDLPF